MTWLRDWWRRFVARHVIADDPMDDERLYWRSKWVDDHDR